MLKRVSVIIIVVIIVVGVEEKFVFFGKDKSRTDIGGWQSGFFRVAHVEYVFAVVLEVSANFVAEIGGCFAVADDFGGLAYPNGAVVGADDELDVFVGNALEGLPQK